MANSKDSRRIQAWYDRLAPIYDKIWSGYLNGTFAVALDVLRLTGKERVLDVACGTGELERRVVEKFPSQSMVGVDMTEGMLKQAREKLARFPNITFQRSASQLLPFSGPEFDIAITCSALHYMRKPQKVFDEMARVLRPGGRCIVIDWCRDAVRGMIYDLTRRIAIRAHHRVFTVDEVKGFLGVAGLTPISVKRFSVQLAWGMMCIEAKK